ncbi:MAG: hypothetical protein A2151_00135 [Candidatus Muproteobacteria bacterium RBG_16_65_34]|uniref:Uncharacterized protein n=1 Tax=Candidatus Muproteobacteria bacterium RBG_16_65_34 TaxID=1817760 RepID=A0A1F6TVH8_9PROT|nr:MAG: hypothetical protein A2151_00135 [Candidatus Muproteobacteria bacterium RBG_16_65_34]
MATRTGNQRIQRETGAGRTGKIISLPSPKRAAPGEGLVCRYGVVVGHTSIEGLELDEIEFLEAA